MHMASPPTIPPTKSLLPGLIPYRAPEPMRKVAPEPIHKAAVASSHQLESESVPVYLDRIDEQATRLARFLDEIDEQATPRLHLPAALRVEPPQSPNKPPRTPTVEQPRRDPVYLPGAGHGSGLAEWKRGLTSLLESTRREHEERTARRTSREAEALQRFHSEVTPGMIEEAFRLIDKNGDGVLSRTEVIKAVRTNQSVRNILGLGGVVRQGVCRFESRTREQFEAIFERLDADKSKTVSLDEFMRALLPTEPEAPPAPRGLTADAELISFTLDDMPVFVRTILSGARCLDGVGLPMSLETAYEDLGELAHADVGDSALGALSLRSARGSHGSKYAYGMRRDRFRMVGTSPSAALGVQARVQARLDWESRRAADAATPRGGEASASRRSLDRTLRGGAELAAPAVAAAIQYRYPAALNGAGGNSSAANWYQVVDALKGAGVMVPEPLVASVVMLPTPAVGVSVGGTELPAPLILAMLWHRRALQGVFQIWETQGKRTVALSELLARLREACPTLQLSDADVASILELCPPHLAEHASSTGPLGTSATRMPTTAWERLMSARQGALTAARNSSPGRSRVGGGDREGSVGPEVGCHYLWRLLTNAVAHERSAYLRAAVAGGLSSRPRLGSPDRH